MNKNFEKKIDHLVDHLVDKHSKKRDVKWNGSKYYEWKIMPATQKGDCGEEVICCFINNYIDIENAEIINRGKGDFDILTESGVKIECKTATEDINGGFQFNGIKKNIGYDYVFGLGVSPNDLWFNIWSKKEMKKLTVPMTKNGSDTFKLSARKSPNAKYKVLSVSEENFLREWKSKIG